MGNICIDLTLYIADKWQEMVVEETPKFDARSWVGE